jgi:hypothetical protein
MMLVPHASSQAQAAGSGVYRTSGLERAPWHLTVVRGGVWGWRLSGGSASRFPRRPDSVTREQRSRCAAQRWAVATRFPRRAARRRSAAAGPAATGCGRAACALPVCPSPSVGLPLVLDNHLIDVVGQIAKSHAGLVARPRAADRNRRYLHGMADDQCRRNGSLRLNLSCVHTHAPWKRVRAFDPLAISRIAQRTAVRSCATALEEYHALARVAIAAIAAIRDSCHANDELMRPVAARPQGVGASRARVWRRNPMEQA